MMNPPFTILCHFNKDLDIKLALFKTTESLPVFKYYIFLFIQTVSELMTKCTEITMQSDDQVTAKLDTQQSVWIYRVSHLTKSVSQHSC